MTERDFERLHAMCNEALGRYVHAAYRMCDLLGRCHADAMSLDQRSELQSQRSKENEAHERYQNIRTRLLEAARIGYGRSQ